MMITNADRIQELIHTFPDQSYRADDIAAALNISYIAANRNSNDLVTKKVLQRVKIGLVWYYSLAKISEQKAEKAPQSYQMKPLGSSYLDQMAAAYKRTLELYGEHLHLIPVQDGQ